MSEETRDDSSDDSSLYNPDGRSLLPPNAPREETVIAIYWANHSKLPAVLAHKARDSITNPIVPAREPYNPYAGKGWAKQLDETIPEFLRRLPTSTSAAELDWIFVANPYAERETEQNLPRLIEEGERMLDNFKERTESVNHRLRHSAPSAVTKTLNPIRNELKGDLLRLAKETNVVTGKWMLFPDSDDLPLVWRRVVEGTIAGKLGIAAKVATDDGSGRVRLICIYSADFSDLKDVQRLLNSIIELGVWNNRARPIYYYKCDAFTHLGIDSKNRWGLKASLYSSKEFQENTARLSLKAMYDSIKKREQSTIRF